MSTENQPKGSFNIENQIKRNPHPDFKKVESSRDPFEQDIKWHLNQTVNPNWKQGSGMNNLESKKTVEDTPKVELDPFGEGRNPIDNYKLLVSGIIPRPIGFVSTISKDSIPNLAPFSYTTVVNHDPPIFCIGFSGGYKDTCQNILDTKELTINIISEWFIEAANFTSTNSPPEVDEWKLSGLTPLPSTKVRPPHVKESAFSIEAKLIHSHDWTSHNDPEKKTGTLCIVEGINFHIRKDVVNDDMNQIDPVKLKPVSRLGGITYGRTTGGYELPRPDFDKEVVHENAK